MERRVLLNLAAFLVISAIVIGWSVTTLFEIERIDKPYLVTAQFESSPGLANGYEVTYLGHAIGSVKSVRLETGYSEVELKIDRDVKLPAAVDAAARRKSAIGEPYVDLSPTAGTDADDGARLADGDLIPLARTTIPINYGDLFKALNALVAAVDPGQVQTLLDETAAALDGRGDDVRRIIVSSAELTQDTADNAEEIDRLIADLGTIAGVVSDNRDALGNAVDQLSVLSNSLDQIDPSLDRFLTTAPATFSMIARLVAATDGSLVCTIDGLAVLDAVATPEVLQALRDTLREAGLATMVQNKVVGADGVVSLDMLLSFTGETPFYPERRADPVPPQVPLCPERTTTYNDAAEGERATVGAGGESGEADGTTDVPEPAPFVPDPGPEGSSDLPEPELSPLGRIAENPGPPIAGLIALAVLALVASRVWKAWRAPAATAAVAAADDRDDDDDATGSEPDEVAAGIARE